MQHIPPFMRRWQIVSAALIVLMTLGILLSHFVWQPDSSFAEATALQPLTAPDELPEGGAAAAGWEASNAAEEPTPAPATIVVYVTGAVRAPDVYSLPAEARVKDLVMAAGGLADDADSERINLAEHLKDAEHVHVPRQGETTSAAAADAPGTHVATGAGERTVININAAGVAELATLPGIGPALAQRIVDYRTTNGPFASINDLSNVKGIGTALLADIAPKISAESP
jgi:competence protein ComEA